MSAPPPENPELIGVREFARRDKCDEKLVRRAIRDGHLRAHPGGRLDAAQVGTGWRLTNRRRADTSATGARTPPARVRSPYPASAPVAEHVRTLAALAGSVAFDAAAVLLPHLPRLLLEPLLADLARRTRLAAIDLLGQDGVPPPPGFVSWADHPEFAAPCLDEGDWRDAAEEAEEAPPAPPAVAAARLAAASDRVPPLAESEAKKEFYLSLLRQLEYDERIGNVSSNAEFERVFGAVVDTTRSRFLALPAAAAARLAGVTDTAAVFAILTEMVRDALSELSETGFDDIAGRLVPRPPAKPNGGGHA